MAFKSYTVGGCPFPGCRIGHQYRDGTIGKICIDILAISPFQAINQLRLAKVHGFFQVAFPRKYINVAFGEPVPDGVTFNTNFHGFTKWRFGV